MPKLAIYSPAVPPVRSGQAIILYRLLQGLAPETYMLFADERVQKKNAAVVATEPLRAETILLPQITGQPAPLPGRRRIMTTPYYLAREVGARAHYLTKLLRRNKVQTLVACTGDFYGFAAAALAARRAGIKFVAYLFDDYLYQCPGYLRPVAWVLERASLQGAHQVIVTNEFFRDLLLKRHGVEAEVIHNAIDLRDIVTQKETAPFAPGTKNIVFAGTIYNAHYDAFQRLIKAIMAQPKVGDVRLHLFTYQTPEELANAGLQGPMLVHHGYRSQSEIIAAQAHADLLFLPLAFESNIGPLLRTAAPGKTAEYLALGKPILVHAPKDSFISWYFRKHDCGLVCDAPDVTQLAEAVQKGLFDEKRRKSIAQSALRQAEADFDIDKARSAFTRVLRDAGAIA